ncbi:MAG: PepSY-associated TM helix domain-containing protein [Sphingomonas fennica]
MAGHFNGGGPRWRILVRRLHLCLGLALGLLFALLGLTGSALVFYTGIDAALHPAIAAAPGAAPPALDARVWDDALATGRALHSQAGDKWTMEVTGEAGPIPARYYPAPGGHHADRQMLWFSADGRRILRIAPWGGYLMSWLYRLHMELLAGDIGMQIVGWSGVAMLVLLASGLVAWWPRGRWAKAIAFKRDAAPIRRLRDLHKLAGLWSMGLLFVLVATGVLLALPSVTQALLAPAAIPAPRSAPRPAGRIALADAFRIARRAVPDGRIVFVDVPGPGAAPIRVRMQVPGDPHRRFPGSYVFVDPGSGRVLAVHDVRRAGTGTALNAWVRTLHDGTVGGLATRILAVVLGFVPAFLFGTGLLHWLRRRRQASSG